jgi:hypothetical protein
MAELVGYSLSTLVEERRELRKDLLAFMSAYDLIRKRLLESSEESPSRAAGLERWSGTWACIGALELSTQLIEKKILEISELERLVHEGKVPNLDTVKRALSLVKEE